MDPKRALKSWVVTAVLVGSTVMAACDSTTAIAMTRDVATSLSIAKSGAEPGQVTPEPLLLALGDTITLSVLATNPLGLAVPAGTVSWSSSNTAVVQVGASGLVTAVGAGTADVRASTGQAVSFLTTIVSDSVSF